MVVKILLSKLFRTWRQETSSSMVEIPISPIPSAGQNMLKVKGCSLSELVFQAGKKVPF